MTEDVQGFRFRASPRVPFRREVRLRFDRIGGSVSGTTSDLSTEGMFVATAEYKPIGTLVQFELENDGGETIQGLADIVWIREMRQGADREPGMGLHFRYVDPRSRELIAEIVRELLAEKEPAREREVAGPPAGARPLDEERDDHTEPSLVWSEAELPVHGESAEPESTPSSSTRVETTASPSEPLLEAATASEVEPETGPVPLPAAVWTGTEDWRASPVDASTTARGAARSRPRSAGGWLVVVLLVLVAAAAALAYQRWRARESGSGSGGEVAVRPVPAARSDPAPDAEEAQGVEAPAPTGLETPAASAPVASTAPAAGESAGATNESSSTEPTPGEEGEASANGRASVAEPVAIGGNLRLQAQASEAATVVRISAPWEIAEESLRTFRLEAPARFLVRVRGPDGAVPISLDSVHVRRIRIGVHPADGASEVHLVFDLVGDHVGARAAVIDGLIVVTFTR
jgi:uncharacterized protein (TIGR02266 family)